MSSERVPAEKTFNLTFKMTSLDPGVRSTVLGWFQSKLANMPRKEDIMYELTPTKVNTINAKTGKISPIFPEGWQTIYSEDSTLNERRVKSPEDSKLMACT